MVHSPSTSGSIRRLEDADREALLRELDRDPYGCLYLRSLVHEYGVSPTGHTEHGRFHARVEQGRVGAVAFLGNARNLSTAGPAHELESVLDHCLQPGLPLLFVGPVEHAPAVRRGFARAGAQPFLDRDQTYYVLTPDSLAPLQDTPLRPARAEELDRVAEAQAAMTGEDLGIPVSRLDVVKLRQLLRRRMELGKVWVIMEGDRLLFKTEEVARSPEGILVGGVYTDPRARGQGHAARGLAAWARILFGEGLDVLALHVDARNRPAVRAYRRVGFQPHSDLRLILAY
jgi:ribosomal protein S18 acetylase RimI-like enzyme